MIWMLGVWAFALLVATEVPVSGAAAEPFPHSHSAPAITGNPAADPALPPRFGRPGRLLFRCEAQTGHGSDRAEVYASAEDFDEGRQSFFLLRANTAGATTLYPLHGYFLNGSSPGVFMVHDGKGTKKGDAFRIDQSVNMGVLFLRKTGDGLRAILEVFAEEKMNEPTGAHGRTLAEYACRWAEEPRRLSTQAANVRMQPNSGATPPSHWYRESDTTLLTCRASSPEGEYRLELLGSKIWPGHLGFLVVRAPGGEPPVGYNVHLLTAGGRLLIHAHSYPHRMRERTLDTMMETETVIGGLLLAKTEGEYAGWVGLAASPADPYNVSFSRNATMADYAAQGRVVVSPTLVTCR